ncbi:restriction endonuclease subunit S domain-containing protein [Ochrobactrum chromiisoli]|uniref:Restriction endonuclease subunit S n=1 Tax=Ochrobactrum chromiisoli TaxID=2993941 RepID=A0ABT3QJ65_9HYPH|nr:hypothetical protein [Ochrobactrum chromiisoli]MCX2695659.1 hypothetical protein [Ochrobactrum chromiisoli]
MTIAPHRDYCEINVPWIGSIPSHWSVVPLFSVAAERKEPNTGMKEDNLLSLSYGKIITKDISSNDGLLPQSFETYQVVHQDDIVLRLTDLQNDKRSLRSARVQQQGIITSAYVAICPSGVSSNFLNYLLRSYDQSKVLYSMGGGLRQSMKYSDVKWLPLVLPPLVEQNAIATFLDRETAKIDALVNEQKRMIKLLKEKRQAVISHAVTKGLDPNVKLKSSGVEWLGDVPEHWEVKQLRHLIKSILSGTSVNAIDTPATENELGVLKTSCVYSGEFNPSENKTIIPEEYPRVSCPVISDSLIVSRMNTPDLVGAAGLSIENLSNIFLPDRLWQIQFCDASAAFIHLWTLTLEYRAQVHIACAGTSSSMQNLSQDQFKAFCLVVPPLQEQLIIVDKIHTEIQRTKEILDQSEAAIKLLLERRSALISAAVTGKIDVLGSVPDQQVAAE